MVQRCSPSKKPRSRGLSISDSRSHPHWGIEPKRAGNCTQFPYAPPLVSSEARAASALGREVNPELPLGDRGGGVAYCSRRNAPCLSILFGGQISRHHSFVHKMRTI